MPAVYQQPGDVIEYSNSGSAISVGDIVVIDNLIGVALVDIANGATGNVALSGVFSGVPKVSAAVIEQGETLVWDSGVGKFDDNLLTPGIGDISGPCAVAWADAGNGDTTMTVKLTGVPGTVTTST
jgi:predicted RecA/RadA family phage recombinase